MITPINKVKHSIMPNSRNKTPLSAYGIAIYGIGVYRATQSTTFFNKTKNSITPTNKDK